MPHTTSKKRRLMPEVNASSMADIAFLLLIFFLVSTEITQDQGLLVKLPPMTEELDEPINIPPRNLFTVLVNAEDELLVRGEPASISELRHRAKEFISNPSKSAAFPSSPRKAVISLQNDRETSYETYLAVYNELKAAYNELWEALAQERYGVAYSEELPIEVRRDIKSSIPFVLSEADPVDYATKVSQDAGS